MTNAEARFNKSLHPRKPEGSLGRTAQDVHLYSHTSPELCPFCVAFTQNYSDAIWQARLRLTDKLLGSHSVHGFHWASQCMNRFKVNVGEAAERRGGAHMGFSQRIDTILNWTEQSVPCLGNIKGDGRKFLGRDILYAILGNKYSQNHPNQKLIY